MKILFKTNKENIVSSYFVRQICCITCLVLSIIRRVDIFLVRIDSSRVSFYFFSFIFCYLQSQFALFPRLHLLLCSYCCDPLKLTQETVSILFHECDLMCNSLENSQLLFVIVFNSYLYFPFFTSLILFPFL